MTQTLAGERRIVTTAELKAMLARGDKVFLPGVAARAPEILDNFDPADRARLDVPAADNEIVSVEFSRRDTVQCISIADRDHLYITDDMIPTHNTSNIIFLKSTDETMIKTLVDWSGERHVVRRNSKTVTRDLAQLVMRTEGKVSYTSATEKEPVVSYNDLNTLPSQNAIVFRAGQYPVWSRNETIWPMSFMLFANQIIQPGREYSLQTIPTLSSANEFDVNQNAPDFMAMLEKRMAQSIRTQRAVDIYKKATGLDDSDIARLDMDVYSAEIMDIVDTMIAKDEYDDTPDYDEGDESVMNARDFMESEYDVFDDEFEDSAQGFPVATGTKVKKKSLSEEAEVNDEFIHDQENAEHKLADMRLKRYAEGKVSRDMLADQFGHILQDSLEDELTAAYDESLHAFVQDPNFRVTANNGLVNAVDGTVLIEALSQEDIALMRAQAGVEQSRVYSEGEEALSGTEDDPLSAMGKYKTTRAFRIMLVELPHWRDLAQGHFDKEVARAFRRIEDA